MAKVKIITDSTADLPEGMANLLGITVIPLYVNVGGKSYRDGVGIMPDQLFAQVEAGGDFPKTAAPATGDFLEPFTQAREAGQDVVFVGLSARLSGTVQIARIAAEIAGGGHIHVVDSMSLSTGTGILAMEGAHMAAQGIDAAEIARKLEALRPRYRASMLIDTMSYLHKGGRCSTMKLYGANLLGIKPEVELREGLLVPAKLFRGSSAKAVRAYLTYRFADLSAIDPAYVVLSMAEGQKAGVAELAERFIQSLGFFRHIYRVTAGCVISAHVGPGAVGILTRSPA